jgi:hypothetical protein
MLKQNPFSITDYISPELFCNRHSESQKIISAIDNGRNLTLLSIRRLGKTGLIKHVFHKLKERKNTRLLYIDIISTQNIDDFIKLFSNAIIVDEKNNANFIKKIQGLVSGIRGKLVFDQLTGMPEVEINYNSKSERENSLEKIFHYLASQKEKYIIAFDEFQQITEYPQKNMEAILRTHIQHQHKDQFIFSGSNKHLLISIFSDYGRPFYQSSDILELERLETNEYAKFIVTLFKKSKKEIDEDLVKEYIEYYDNHTFYIQYFFNRLFAMANKKQEISDFEICRNTILKEKENIFYTYRNLLTTAQFTLLKSIAKEKELAKPNSKVFLHKYNLTASSVNRTLKALIDKEMVYQEKSNYKVYDVFLSKWLEKN